MKLQSVGYFYGEGDFYYSSNNESCNYVFFKFYAVLSIELS